MSMFAHGLILFQSCSIWRHQSVAWRNVTVPSRKERQWQHHRAAKEMRAVPKEVSKQFKRNRKPKRVRHKDWMPDSFDDDYLNDLDDLPRSERIMPHGERDRRRAVKAAIVTALEGQDEGENEIDNEEVPTAEKTPGQPGIVVEVSSNLCRVALEDTGHSLVCGLRGSLSAEDTGFTNVIAVGDRVVVSGNGTDRGIVEAVLPRQNILARHDVFYTHLQQVIVANADQVLIVASWRAPHFWPELVDRYLIAAERNNLVPVICVNKVDLAEDVTTCRAEVQPYLDLGHQVIFTSAITGEGIDELRQMLRGQTTVLAGMSGVGKSSLLNAIQPGLQIQVKEVSDRSREGRHTTTQVSMKELDLGGFVVDTPGIREFGLGGLRQAELVCFYPEIATAAERCRFGDCSHTHEPGCAVKAAVKQGHVSATRFHNYRCIYDTLPS